MPGGVEGFRQRLLDAASAVRSQHPDSANPTNHPALPPPAYLSSSQNANEAGELHASSLSYSLPELLSNRSANAQWQGEFRYVLLCVNTKRLKTLGQIEVGSVQNDQHLFRNIREEYLQIRRENEWTFSMVIPTPPKRLTQRFPECLALPPKFVTWIEDMRVHTPRSADFIRVCRSTPSGAANSFNVQPW